MAFFRDYLFPWGCEFTMSRPEFTRLRQDVLKDAAGEVLEIGFGTGLNLPHYPDTVGSITTVDPNPGMNRRAEERIAASPLPVRQLQLGGEELPLDSASFDCVVSTWTLCSIPAVKAALFEIRRVMKPEGRFIFLEHGLSDEPRVAKWQNRLNPVQKAIGDGCNLNRDMKGLVEGAGFRIAGLENFYMDKTPRTHGYLFKGTARVG